MLVRRIALVDVIADTQSAFASMLRVIAGRTRCRWEVVDDPAAADLILTQFEAEHPRIGRWANSGKRFLSIVDPKAPWPLMRYALSHPFRAANVEAILDEIAGEMDVPDVASQDASAAASWNFPRALKALSHSALSDVDYCARAASGDLIWVCGDLSCYAAEPRVVERIRAGAIKFEGLVAIGMRPPPAKLQPRPLLELFWHSAFFAGDSLAPWLRSGARFRLRRWPDFGVIRSSRASMQIVAWLASGSRSAAELVRLSAAPPTLVHRTLNALSVCRLLTMELPDAAMTTERGASARPAHSPGLIKSLVSGLRKRLGWGG